jgi:copper transport protein
VRKLVWFVAVAAGVVLQTTPAVAHAERSDSTPREGAAVATAPEELHITFTEPPTGDAVAEVLDGCGREVVTGIEVQNFEITARLASGQPGKWTVQTNVISGVDGHNTRDRWSFKVRGEPDCSAPETEAPDAAGDPEDSDDGGSSAFPLIALVAATLVLVAVGVALRNR